MCISEAKGKMVWAGSILVRFNIIAKRVRVAWLYVMSVHHMHPVLREARRGHWMWSHTWLSATVWILEI